MPAASADSPPAWRFSLIVGAILAARLLIAANLHLTEDEAYYRLWSMAPAFGYYDHPPMIAWWIAIGRAMVGDNALGVRLLPSLGSAATSLLVFDMAGLAGADRRTAERAGLWFNTTLLVACGGFLAVPDAPAALFWCLTLWSVLKAVRKTHDGNASRPRLDRHPARNAAQRSVDAGPSQASPENAQLGPGPSVAALAPSGMAVLGGDEALVESANSIRFVWWLLAGLAAGLATLSKYSALFLGPGILLWLVSSQEGRRRLLTPGPWLALIAAAAVFGINVAWNATHHWLTFAKQFGRVAPHGLTARYLPELLITQALLLNPMLLVFLARWRPSRSAPAASVFLLSSAPFAAYLVLHSLHDRVQAHWPAPLYPAAAILAAFAASRAASGKIRSHPQRNRHPARNVAQRSVDAGPSQASPERARLGPGASVAALPPSGMTAKGEARLDFGEGGLQKRPLRLAVPGVTIVALLVLTALAALPPSTFARSPDLFLPLRGWRTFGQSLEAERREAGAAWIGTTSYGLASELADERLGAPIVQISERDRWRGPSTGASPRFNQPGLVVDLTRRLDPARLHACFVEVRFIGDTPRGAAGERPKLYGVYRVVGPRRDIVQNGCW